MTTARRIHATGTRSNVRARAPLRLGLAGGGTDLDIYASQFSGAVLNATIDRYAFAFISPRFDGRVCFRARDLKAEELHESDEAVSRSRLLLHRGVYERIVRDHHGGEPLPVTVTTTVDVPMGSGLGSSSALVVALVDAYCAFLGVPLGPYDVAKLAWEIERRDLSIAGGKQDQYAAAFGGVNFIEFLAGDRVIVNPLRVPARIRNEIESSLITCFTGRSRASDEIIREQTRNISSDSEDVLSLMHELKADAFEMKGALLSGDIDRMAEIMSRTWETKRRTARSVGNTEITEIYQLARSHGALAGKVSGAGGGGFMTFIVRPERRLDVVDALAAAGLQAGPVKFTSDGSETWSVALSSSGVAVTEDPPAETVSS